MREKAGIVPPAVHASTSWKTAEVAGAGRLDDLDGTGDFHTPQTAMVPYYQFPLDELKPWRTAAAKFKIPTFAQQVLQFAELDAAATAGSTAICAPRAPMPRQPCFFFMKRPCTTSTTALPAIGHADHPFLARRISPPRTSTMDSTAPGTKAPRSLLQCGTRARTNIDGSFATCFLGKAAYYDMHVTENLYATVLVKTERTIRSDLEWDVFGLPLESCALRRPRLTGTAKRTYPVCQAEREHEHQRQHSHVPYSRQHAGGAYR